MIFIFSRFLTKRQIHHYYASAVIVMLTSCDYYGANNSDLSFLDEHIDGNDVLYLDLKNRVEAKDSPLTVTVSYDHYFKTTKRYHGYALKTIIDSVIQASRFDTTNAFILFECKDGYNPIMNLSKLYRNTKGYLAYRDLDFIGVNKWPDSINHLFSPYYLVWDSVSKEDTSFAWPYGLVGIRIMSGYYVSQTICPKDSEILLGFELFLKNCMQCHSINSIGGTKGPEFNAPKNITEYWKENDIISFARNPNGYRHNSKMPSLSNISLAEYKKIVSYIKHMKAHKLFE